MIRFAAVVAGAVLAPVGALPAAPAPAGDWNGLYVGGHFGGAWGRSEWFDLGAGNIGSHDASGIIGGGQTGYNFQSGPWVLGAQASLSGADLGGSHIDTV